MLTKDFLKQEMTAAMKAGDKPKLSVLRMMLSEVSYGETASKPVSVFDSVMAYRKKLGKAMDEHPTEALAYELSVVESYLPREPTAEELDAFVLQNDLSGKSLPEIIKAIRAHFPAVSGKLAKETADKWHT